MLRAVSLQKGLINCIKCFWQIAHPVNFKFTYSLSVVSELYTSLRMWTSPRLNRIIAHSSLASLHDEHCTIFTINFQQRHEQLQCFFLLLRDDVEMMNDHRYEWDFLLAVAADDDVFAAGASCILMYIYTSRSHVAHWNYKYTISLPSFPTVYINQNCLIKCFVSHAGVKFNF